MQGRTGTEVEQVRVSYNQGKYILPSQVSQTFTYRNFGSVSIKRLAAAGEEVEVIDEVKAKVKDGKINKVNMEPVVKPFKLPPGIEIKKCEKSVGEVGGSRAGEAGKARFHLPAGTKLTRVEGAESRNTDTKLPMMEVEKEAAVKEADAAKENAGKVEELIDRMVEEEVAGKAEEVEEVAGGKVEEVEVVAASPAEVMASIDWAEVFKLSAAAT